MKLNRDPQRKKILPLFRPYTFSHKLGRLRKFGVPELLNAIGGIADADYVDLAAASGERCEAEDYLIKLQSLEFGPEPDGVVTGA